MLKVHLLNDQATLPVRGSPGAAGWDLASSAQVSLQPGERHLVPLGLSLEVPPGCYGRSAPRSSMALRGVDVAGGVVDADFRGEVKIILVNNGAELFVVNVGDRVGQLILEKIAHVNLEVPSSLSSTVRGTAGFGSTGVNSLASSSPSGSQALGSGTEGASVRRLSTSGCGAIEIDVLPMVGPHVFFEGVLFAKDEESLPHFVRRLRDGELANFRWMFPDSLIEELESPSRRSPASFQVEVQQGTLNIIVFKHGEWRKKLYDTEVGAPPSNDGITAGVVNVPELDDGRVFARVDNRRGNRSMVYLKQNWTGVSIFYALASSNVQAC